MSSSFFISTIAIAHDALNGNHHYTSYTATWLHSPKDNEPSASNIAAVIKRTRLDFVKSYPWSTPEDVIVSISCIQKLDRLYTEEEINQLDLGLQ